MESKNTDEHFMRRALQLAGLGGAFVAPNPKVGAVIVCDGKIIGEGYHQKYGEAHAEINAINSVQNKELIPTSTIYVTLEPCSHYGKTPPCADAIVKLKFKRVVIGCIDSFSEVSGRGIERIRKAGITVTVGVLEKEARLINKRFFTFHEKKRPYVILKWAQTQDGYLDRLPENRQKGVNWITQPETKILVHKWRSEEQVILVGANTIINDNPSLTVREINGKNPIRVILDPDNIISTQSVIFQDNVKTFIFNNSPRKTEFLGNHIEFITIQDFSIPSILKELYNLGFLSIFVEGGAFTLNKFIEANCWDEARVLKGNTNFEHGIPAPEINAQRVQSNFGKDEITYYFNT